MVADNNKKSAPGAQETNSQVRVGGDGNKTARRYKSVLKPFQRIGWKKPFVAMLAILVLATGWAVIEHKTSNSNPNLYAEAAGHKIYKKDVQGLIGNNKDISKQRATEVLADKYLTEALAKEREITVTDQDIQAQYGSGADLKQLKKDSPYSYQAQVNSAYFDKLRDQVNGIYKGYVLVTQFNRYIPARPVDPGYKKAIPQMGDPKAIAADKKYAENLINSLYNRIKAGEITWEQAAQIEKQDPVVGTKPYPALSHSGPFDTSKDAQPLFTAPGVQKTINGLKAGQTSKPFVVSVYSAGTGKTNDSYFLVVRMDSRSGGSDTGDFSQYLTQAKKRLGYHIYV